MTLEHSSPDRTSKPVLWWVMNKFHLGGAELGLLHLIENGFFDEFDVRIKCMSRGDELFYQKVEALVPIETMRDQKDFSVSDWALFVPWLAKKMKKQQPDIMILSLTQANIAARIATICMRAIKQRTPYVISFEHNTQLSKKVYETLFKWTRFGVDGFFADAQMTIDETRRRFHKGCTQPYWIVPLFSFEDKPADSKPWPHDPVRLMNAGRMTFVKNQKVVIQALALLRRDNINATFTLYGEGELREELEEEVRRLEMQDYVSMPGFVDDWTEKPADIFVLPSLFEGLSIVTLEAMRMRCAVIAPAIGGIKEYGALHVTFLENNSPEHIVSKVKEVLSNPEQTWKKIEEQYAVVMELYSSDKVKQQFQAASKDLLQIAQSR